MLRKIGYVLDRKQKINIFLLLIMMFIGAFVELLGVSAILPLVELAADTDSINKTWYLIYIKEIFGLTDAKQMMIFLSILLIVIYILKNVYITVEYNLQYKLTFENQKNLAVKMMKCYMDQGYLFHVSRNMAELQRNVVVDVDGFFTVVLNFLQFVSEISVCAVLFIFLFTKDVVTTLVVSVLSIILGLFIVLVYKKILVSKGEKSRDFYAQVNKWLLQAFSGIKEIKVVNNEDFFVHNYDVNYKQFTIIRKQQSMLKFIPRPLMETVCICGLLLAVIINLQFAGTDIKTLIPTLSIFAVAAFRVLPSFNRISGYLGSIMFDLPSINAIYEDLVELEKLTSHRKQEEDTAVQIGLKESIKVENLSFRYPETEKWILKDANLEILKNKSIGLIGASGAGKTTLVDVILGLLEPQKGCVKVDGVDIRKHMPSWHKSIGYIPQTIYLMDDTIRANIAFGIPDGQIDEELLKNAVKEAQLDTFVRSLPEGMNTIVGDRGVKLSGGQRQRIGIARALYRDPQVLILDEATSALDNETEQEVMEAIDGLHGQRTMIVIAHRLTTIKNCDSIYEVGDGTIFERNRQEVFE